jgi:anthranilate synthase component 1
MGFLETIEKAPIGSIVPVYKELDLGTCPVDFFAKLSDCGRKKNSILLESADIVKKYGEKSLGSANPCLLVKGKGNAFSITALNAVGERFLRFIEHDFGFCKSIRVAKREIRGQLEPAAEIVSEEERLKLKTHEDILRAVAFKFRPTEKPFVPSAGLFGVIGYDFIDQFERLPKNRADLLRDPDFEMLFLDNMFMVEHKKRKLLLVANALKTDENNEALYEQCLETIHRYEEKLAEEMPPLRKKATGKISVSTDTGKKEFENMVEKMKKHIVSGDIFQVVPSRTIIAEYGCEELDIYRQLRTLNPSPYMFYFRDSGGVLLGSSPETCLKVVGNQQKTIEIRPIAGTRPRGIVKGKINRALDAKLEQELLADEKEMAEHTMLVDLARNDVARVSVAGTRRVGKLHSVEKYSHVMHLVSNVHGVLLPELDALHAYLASMNMGTLTGAPKIKAMELLRKYEKTARGFYGGAFGYLTPNGDFDSCIVIRSMRLKGNRAFIRAGAGIVFDSVPSREFEETEGKARACLEAIELAQRTRGEER